MVNDGISGTRLIGHYVIGSSGLLALPGSCKPDKAQRKKKGTGIIPDTQY